MKSVAPRDVMRTKSISLDGDPFTIPRTGMFQWKKHTPGSRYFGGAWEHLVSDVVCAIPSGANFLDAGASFGPYTVLAAKRTTGMVYAFEPCPVNFGILKDNVRSLSNVQIIEAALGAEVGAGFLRLIPHHHGSHSLVAKNTPDAVDVRITTVDALGVEIHTMKIDVEGGGAELLQGAEETLKTVSIIVMELHNDEESDSWDVLRDIGFTVTPFTNKGMVARRDRVP